MGLDEFIKELKTKYPNANYESILKMVGTIYGKQETSKQILRASWVFDVCWHVHNKSGTMFKYAKENLVASKLSYAKKTILILSEHFLKRVQLASGAS